MGLDYIDVATIMFVLVIGGFLASIVWRLYTGGQNDMHHPRRY